MAAYPGTRVLDVNRKPGRGGVWTVGCVQVRSAGGHLTRRVERLIPWPARVLNIAARE